MNESLQKLVALQQTLQPIAQKIHNAIPRIDPEVLASIAELHSKIAPSPATLNSIQKLAEQFKQIEPTIFSILQNDAFKALVAKINSMQLDKLSESDFEALIQQLQIKDNGSEAKKQATQTPIFITLILAMLVAFLEQTGSNISDVFMKPQLEKLYNKLENNMDEVAILTDLVNLREAPSGNAKSLLKIEANQTVKVLSKSGNWFKVRYFYSNDEYVEGWVFKRYAKTPNEKN